MRVYVMCMASELSALRLECRALRQEAADREAAEVECAELEDDMLSLNDSLAEVTSQIVAEEVRLACVSRTGETHAAYARPRKRRAEILLTGVAAVRPTRMLVGEVGRGARDAAGEGGGGRLLGEGARRRSGCAAGVIISH